MVELIEMISFRCIENGRFKLRMSLNNDRELENEQKAMIWEFKKRLNTIQMLKGAKEMTHQQWCG